MQLVYQMHKVTGHVTGRGSDARAKTKRRTDSRQIPLCAHFSLSRKRSLNPSSTATRRSPSVTLLENRKASLYPTPSKCPPPSSPLPTLPSSWPMTVSTSLYATLFHRLLVRRRATRLYQYTPTNTLIRPRSSRPSSPPLRSRLSPSGPPSSPRYEFDMRQIS